MSDRWVARTVAEAYVFLELTLPEGEGAIDFGRFTTLEDGDDGWVLRFDGPYEGRHHTVEVAVPVPPGDPEERRWYGPGRSTLVDAGQWHLIELGYAGMAAIGEGQIAETGVVDHGTYWAVVGAWDDARAAVDEIAKFLVPDVDLVADDGFWTAQGEHLRARHPEAFGRTRLAEATADYERRLADFQSRVEVPPEMLLEEPSEPAPVPVRTFGEAHIYLDLHPCVCGESQFQRSRMSVLGDGELGDGELGDGEHGDGELGDGELCDGEDGDGEDGVVVRFAAPCDGCGLPRDVTFRLPQRRGLPPESPYHFRFVGDAPSEVIDSAGWTLVAEGYQAAIDEVAVLGGPPEGWSDPENREDMVKMLTVVAAAYDEALLSLPQAEAAHRPELERRRAEGRRRLDEFVSGYGH